MALIGLSSCGLGSGGEVDSFEVPRAAEVSEFLAESEHVRFSGSDGVELDGRLFGSGRASVVLSHMGDPSDNQVEWFPMARALAERGYAVLTYNARGVCPGAEAGCSSGTYDLSKNWSDIVGALEFLVDRGSDRVVLMGASVGSMGSLIAAARPGVDAAAVVAISGVEYCCGYDMRPSILAAVEEPKLFLAGRGDASAARGARRFFKWSEEPKSLEILDAVEHGSYLFAAAEPNGSRARDAVFDFLERWAPTRIG